MKGVILFVLVVASAVSVFSAPVPSPGEQVSSLNGTEESMTDDWTTDLVQAIRRDGQTEFDTDLCLLKKRTGVIGEGIDNCDM